VNYPFRDNYARCSTIDWPLGRDRTLSPLRLHKGILACCLRTWFLKRSPVLDLRATGFPRTDSGASETHKANIVSTITGITEAAPVGSNQYSRESPVHEPEMSSCQMKYYSVQFTVTLSGWKMTLLGGHRIIVFAYFWLLAAGLLPFA
jgi:hypothetical protein